MSYLKRTNHVNKAKFPTRISKTPKDVCNKCNNKITAENREFSSIGGFRKTCKPCLRKIGKEFNRKKQQTIKNNPLW